MYCTFSDRLLFCPIHVKVHYFLIRSVHSPCRCSNWAKNVSSNTLYILPLEKKKRIKTESVTASLSLQSWPESWCKITACSLLGLPRHAICSHYTSYTGAVDDTAVLHESILLANIHTVKHLIIGLNSHYGKCRNAQFTTILCYF